MITLKEYTTLEIQKKNICQKIQKKIFAAFIQIFCKIIVIVCSYIAMRWMRHFLNEQYQYRRIFKVHIIIFETQ